MRKPKYETHCLSLQDTQWERLLVVAGTERSVSSVVRDAIKQYLAKVEK